MKLGIFAKTFAGPDPATVLNAAAAAGYDGVAYNMACSGLTPMPDLVSDADVAAITAAVRASGQTLFSLSGTYNMIHPDPSVRAAGHARLAILASRAHDLGTSLITLCTGSRDAEDQWRHHPDNASAAAWADLCASFAVAVRIAEDHDICLGVEPELANVVNSAAAARRLIDQMGSPRIKIVLDPANLFETGDPKTVIDAAVDLLAPDLAMAHAKDRDQRGGFVAAGRGVVDFGHFIARLNAAGFAGAMVTHGLSAAEAPKVARYLRARL